jgi:hypothetical protein
MECSRKSRQVAQTVPIGGVRDGGSDGRHQRLPADRDGHSLSFGHVIKVTVRVDEPLRVFQIRDR